MFPLFIYYVSGHCLSESSLKLILASVFMTGFKKQKEHILHKWDFTVLLKQNNFCIMNKIKLVWFYSLYKKFFLSKNAIFLYNLKIFFDMLHLKILSESWIVCIFSMCVKAISHLVCKRNVAATSLFLFLQMRKSFVYWHFPEMSIPLKSRNNFNFFAPNKCRFLFKPIIFVYSCKLRESL